MSFLPSPMVLAVGVRRDLYFPAREWVKLHNLAEITSFFASLTIPFNSVRHPFVFTLAGVSGMLLMVRRYFQLFALLLAGNILMAYLTSHR